MRLILFAFSHKLKKSAELLGDFERLLRGPGMNSGVTHDSVLITRFS